MGGSTAGQVAPDTLVQVSANLEAYVAERAGRMAEAALARAKAEAAEQLKTVREKAAAERRRHEDLIAELRRQLETCDKIMERHGELAVVLDRPPRTQWDLLIAQVRKMIAEREQLEGAERGERAADQEVERLQRELADLRGMYDDLCGAMSRAGTRLATAERERDEARTVAQSRGELAEFVRQQRDAVGHAAEDEHRRHGEEIASYDEVIRRQAGQVVMYRTAWWSARIRAARRADDLAGLAGYDAPMGAVLYSVIRGVQAGHLDEHEAVRQIELRLIMPLAARKKKAEADLRRVQRRTRRRAEARDVEPPVTVPEHATPAMTRCPHRDFDDPTRCPICHP